MTRSCTECGAPVEEDESFCGQCGSYLEWEDAPDDSPAAAEEPVPAGDVGADEAAPAEATAPLWKQVTEQARRAIERPGEQKAGPTAARADESGVGLEQPAQASVPSRPSTEVERAAAEPVERVEPRRPQAAPPPARPKPRPKPVDEELLRPGDLVCGSCGVGNAPTRKFCRRCGHTLAEATVVHVPWWRRVLVRRRNVHAVGSRPEQSPGGRSGLSGLNRMVPVAGVLALLAVGGYLARPWLQETGATVLDVVRGSEGFEASGVRATSAAPGHPARAIIDTDPTKYWAPVGDPRGQSVTATFAEPQRLVHLLLSPGASVTKKSEWVAVGRPRTVIVVLRRGEGADEKRTVELADQMGTVQMDIGVSDVSAVTLRLQRSYPGQSQELVALGELEFFVRG
jgi:hypothetical protein